MMRVKAWLRLHRETEILALILHLLRVGKSYYSAETDIMSDEVGGDDLDGNIDKNAARF